MQTYDRLFGSGTRIHLMMLALLVLVYFLRISYSWTTSYLFEGSQLTLGFVMLIVWGIIGLWSLNSLGRKIGLSLMRSGPYRYMRHPMYASEILFGWLAAFFILNTWLAIIAMLVSFYLASHLVHYEEEMMEHSFHDEWRNYAKETPRFFPKFQHKTAKQIPQNKNA